MSGSSGGPPAISVVVSTRDRADRLSALLLSLAEQTMEPDSFEVVVVDNGSIDSTPQLLEDSAQGLPYSLRVLRRPRGEGPAPARNEGVEAARAPLIAFTDDDCVATPEWLAAGTAALADADLVQGSVRPDPGVVPGPHDRSVWVDRESGLYETANLFARRETIERAGGFEPLFPAEVDHVIGEDVWFGWRARRAGARTAFCDEARVHHAVIPRAAAEAIAERRRLRHFPALAKQVPELRVSTFFARVFLSRRSAEFDLALVSALAAKRWISIWPLLGALPYLATIASRTARRGHAAPSVVAAEAAADLVGFGSLVEGSVRARSLLL